MVAISNMNIFCTYCFCNYENVLRLFNGFISMYRCPICKKIRIVFYDRDAKK